MIRCAYLLFTIKLNLYLKIDLFSNTIEIIPSAKIDKRHIFRDLNVLLYFLLSVIF